MMKKTRSASLTAIAILLILFPMLAGWPAVVHTQPPSLVYGNNSGTVRPISVDATGDILLSNVDPCASSAVAKSSAVLAVTADAIVVALTSGQTIYVCGWVATIAGTAPTYRFQTGTGSACATGVAQLSGTFAPTVGSFNTFGGGGSTVLAGAVSGDLCIDVGGTTPDVEGVITYVKMVAAS